MSAKSSLPELLPLDLYDLTEGDNKRFAEEMALGMVDPQAEILNRVAKAVKPSQLGTSEVQKSVDNLMRAARGQRQGSQRRTLVGLAAPQIGESLRIIVVDTRIGPDRKRPGTLECFINPEIIWRTRDTEESREGCFSAGPVWGLVRRPVAVKIRAFTPDGKQVEKIFEGFTARIIQHEIDHLNGIRFPDQIKSDRKRHWVHAEEISFYPEHINHWPRLCTLGRWQKFIRALERN